MGLDASQRKRCQDMDMGLQIGQAFVNVFVVLFLIFHEGAPVKLSGLQIGCRLARVMS